MRLCDHHRLYDPREVLDRPSWILQWWSKYIKEVGRLGVDRDDILFGLLTQITANANRKKNSKAIQLQDVMPYYKEREPTQEELRAKIESIFGKR